MVVRNHIAELRRARGESLARVGRAVGIDVSQLHRMERGRGGCSFEKMTRLAAHFEVPLTDLFVVVPSVDN